VTIVKNLTIE